MIEKLIDIAVKLSYPLLYVRYSGILRDIEIAYELGCFKSKVNYYIMKNEVVYQMKTLLKLMEDDIRKEKENEGKNF